MQKREFGTEEYEPGGQGEQVEEEGEEARYWPAKQVEEGGREVDIKYTFPLPKLTPFVSARAL